MASQPKRRVSKSSRWPKELAPVHSVVGRVASHHVQGESTGTDTILPLSAAWNSLSMINRRSRPPKLPSANGSQHRPASPLSRYVSASCAEREDDLEDSASDCGSFKLGTIFEGDPSSDESSAS